MRIDNIHFEDIIGTNLFSENPNICFVSPIYSKDMDVINKGRKQKLDDSADYSLLLGRIMIKNIKTKLIVKNLLFVLVFSLTTSLLGTIINVGPNILPREPGYWKYMALQLSILSAFLFGFSILFELYFFKKHWTQRCISNASVLKEDREEKCGIETAKEDLIEMFKHCNISLSNKRPIPYGSKYFYLISKEMRRFSYSTNLTSEYNKNVTLINSRPDLLKSIVALVVGVGIEIFSFLDTFDALSAFRNNMIVSASLIIPLSIFLGYSMVSLRFEKTYIKLDALLYLYSYMYLDMPFNPNAEEYKKVEISYKNTNNIEAMVEYEISKLSEQYSQHIFYRLVISDESCLKIYGIKNSTFINY